MTAKAPGAVQSVERVFDLLELITDRNGDASLSELASSTGLPLPTIHRLLRTLVGMGYARQLPDRRYELGPRLIRLGEGASKRLGALARPYLRRLVSTLGETANMAVLDADMALYVAQVPSPHAMRMFTEIGRHAHTHATGVGKAILAQLDDATATALVERAGMPTPTSRSVDSVPRLLKELHVIRARGYAIDEQEQEVGVRCISVAVPHAPTPTAISVSGPVARVDSAFAERAVPLLRSAAAAMSHRMAVPA